MRTRSRYATAVVGMVTSASMVFADDTTPRPEHPQPQMQRAEWLCLNGLWDFAETDDNNDASFLTAAQWPARINVPFCRESRLSGVAKREFVKNVWYRRTFDVPAEWLNRRVRLHIGACDWRTTVWVNGKQLGTHEGGNTPVTVEFTDVVRPTGNVVVVHAFDDTRSGLQQLGKQSDRPESHGIFYTRTTGIWQTVWLEAVGSTFITRLRLHPDLDAGRVRIESDLDGDAAGLTVTAEVRAGDKVVGAAHRPAGFRDNMLDIALSEKRPWSLDSPFLHDVRLELRRGDAVVDRLDSYFGLRKIEIRGPLFLLNDKPVFQRLVLDQGFYPDGVWTAPTDAALRGDIELSKAAGFNGARLHQKVFEPRFHYWADKLGYLTWGESPSYGANYANPAVNRVVIQEWNEIIQRDRNHPSIVGWCPFNETPPEAGPLQNTILELTHALDPSRPVIETSGWVKSHPNPDVDCRHDYDQNPASLAARWANIGGAMALPARYGRPLACRPFFLSEFGGIGWLPEGHEGWGYGNTPKTLDEFYQRYAGVMGALQQNRWMFGFCYTQLTDVEQERNGVYYFDRSAKFDMRRIHDATAAAAQYELHPPPVEPMAADRWSVLLSSAADAVPAEWRYTESAPPQDWQQPAFDDAGWKSGRAGFGHKEGWESRTSTPWTSPDIWLRTSFEFDGAAAEKILLVLHYDNATSVFLNGKPLVALEGWNDSYAATDVTAAAKPLLTKGRNTLAVHVHQDTGGQFFDAAILVSRGGGR
ncbi:MAG: Beta-galactosidase [Phycisphaerae bacterium]|nr:Beta-galactosidase [Phycisphaerae bacterium]